MFVRTPPCPRCGGISTVEVTPEEHEQLQGGVLIQKVLPRMSAAERELLITGFHSDCWDKTFKGPED